LHVLRILAALDEHFRADDQSPADVNRWQELKRHMTRLRSMLSLAEDTLRAEVKRGISLKPEEVGRLILVADPTNIADQMWCTVRQLDEHFAADNVSPADLDQWRKVKAKIVRMKDSLHLARIELEGCGPEDRVLRALQHVRRGLGEEMRR
jgi:hypothetical protein